MSKNLKNIFKFVIALLALILFAYCVSKTDTDDFSLWHIAGMVVSIDVGIWYCWHVFNNKE